MQALCSSVGRRQGAVRAEEAGSPHAPAAPAVLCLNRAAPGAAAHSPAPPCRCWEVSGARGIRHHHHRGDGGEEEAGGAARAGLGPAAGGLLGRLSAGLRRARQRCPAPRQPWRSAGCPQSPPGWVPDPRGLLWDTACCGSSVSLFLFINLERGVR